MDRSKTGVLLSWIDKEHPDCLRSTFSLDELVKSLIRHNNQYNTRRKSTWDVVYSFQEINKTSLMHRNVQLRHRFASE